MKRYTGMITVVFIAIALAIPAGGQMYERGLSVGVERGFARRRAALNRIKEIRANLTIEQRDAIGKARDAFLDETAGLRNDINKKHAEFREFLKNENPGKSEVMALRKEIMDLRSILFEKKFDLRQKQSEIVKPGNTEGQDKG